jgi:hypothetical protein
MGSSQQAYHCCHVPFPPHIIIASPFCPSPLSLFVFRTAQARRRRTIMIHNPLLEQYAGVSCWDYYERYEQIARGQVGKVYLGAPKGGREQVAIKVRQGAGALSRYACSYKRTIKRRHLFIWRQPFVCALCSMS